MLRTVVAISATAALLFGASALRAAAGPGMHAGPSMHAVPMHPVPMHPVALPHSAQIHVPSLPPAHGSVQDSDDRVAPRSSSAHSNAQPQLEIQPVHRPFLPWWFRRRDIAAPLPPLF